MRIRSAVFVALVFAARLAVADVTAPATIAADAVWTASEGPYLVAEDVTVAAGATLTVEAGTTVRFGEGRSLVVAGALVARGTEAAPVRFTSEAEGGSWGAIVFEDGAVDAAFGPDGEYVSGSILEGCLVERGTRALGLRSAAPFVHACTFRDNLCPSSAVEEAGGAAIHVGPGSTPRIVACIFVGNKATGAPGGAIGVEFADPVIQDCTFRGNRSSYGGAIAAYGMAAPIVGCTFEDNEGGLEGGAVSLVSSQPAFLANRVVNNHALNDGGGVHVCVDCFPHACPIVLDNVITGNRNELHGAAGLGAAFLRALSGNDIHGNTRQGAPSDLSWFDPVATQPAWVSTLDASGNWWGTTDEAAIAETIADGQDDPAYGLVTFAPVADGPVATPQPRAAITTRKLAYGTDGEPMPVFLTLYNPGPARELELLVFVDYGDAPVPYRGPLDVPGATRADDRYRLALAANAVVFTRLLAPPYVAAPALPHGTWSAALFDATTGERLGDLSRAGFDLGSEGE